MSRILLRAALASFVTVPAANAQTVDSGASGLPEIIVTAEKRPENINTVPIVVAVLTNPDLVRSGIDSTQQLEWATPGLVFGNTNGFAEPYIRGVGTDLITPGQDSPVGFYLDGVYLPFASGLVQQFGDVTRIEVLKGPQGTLYGRNTTGGAVNIVTRDPEPTFSAAASVSAGNQGYAKATTYVTGGLSEGLSANFAGVYTYHNGFFDVSNSGSHLGDLNQFGLRSKIKYSFNDSWSALIGADYLQKHDSSDAPYSGLVGSNTPLPAGVGPSFRPYTTYTDLEPTPHRTATASGANLTVRGSMSQAELTAITGFRDDHLVSTSDGDGTSLPLYAYAAVEGEQQITQEIQLISSGSAPLQWIAGLYFLDATAFEGPVNVWAGIPIADPPNAAVALEGRTRITSYAGYGQASYQLPHGFELTAGVRTTHERRKLTVQRDSTTDFLNLLPRADTPKSWTSTTPKATIQWETPGQLLYASYSTGFKAGSYNLVSPGSPVLDPEEIKAYEVGGKHDLRFLNHGHLNWAVFYYNYRNIQLTVQDPAIGGEGASQNAASSLNRGVDLDLAVPILRRLTTTISLEYLNARYESYPDAAIYNIVDGKLDTLHYTKSADASGNREERAPLLTSSVNLQWTLPIRSGNISTTIAFYHNSGFYLDAGQQFQQKSYNLANLHIEYAPQGNHWSVAAWIRNAFNATVMSGVGVSPFIVGAFYNDPRLFGVSAAVHY